MEQAVYDSCELLAVSPRAGTVREDLTSLPVTFWLVPPFPNYFIVYDPETKPLEIVRILHRARDIRSLIP